MATSKPNGAFRFGVFELNSSSGELRKHGIRIKLQDKPFQVLLMLVNNAGNVVSRDEIRAELWSSHTFVDFDGAISTAIRKVREALGDSSEMPRFLETVAGEVTALSLR